MYKVKTQVASSNFGTFGNRLSVFEDPKIVYFGPALSVMQMLRDFLMSDYLIINSCLQSKSRTLQYPFDEHISQLLGETWTLRTPVADFLFEILD